MVDQLLGLGIAVAGVIAAASLALWYLSARFRR
jgi:hypothetical protein